jgi:insertion element IS1 protein InsB
MNNLSCPRCGLSHIKRNGHTYYRKQNYQCLSCRRQFVKDAHRIDSATRVLVKKLLLERVSLRGICRVLSISLAWLLDFIVEVYEQLPDDLYVQPVTTPQRRLQLLCLEAEADETWSFVRKRANKRWVWLAFDPQTKLVLAFYVGDRSRNSARQLWKRLPRAYREQATFYTDDWEAYRQVIPASQHKVCDKGSGHTNAIERFNCTLRQRVSRLVRKTLSFSKKLENHIGAIKYFICHYNQEVIRLV